MILGALVGVGVDRVALVEHLARLDVPGWEIKFETVDRSGISAVRAHVQIPLEHQHRHLSHIQQIIESSRLSDNVKERALQIFARLGAAEARVHNVPIERIHFHEVGALDAILDVVGACIGFELLGIERFVCSPLHVGSGMVEMAHGRFPVPPPAVTELLGDAPIYSSDIIGELLTPTGAAIISTVCEEYGPLPAMRLERAGYGAGAREYKRFPNVLRVMLGASDGRATLGKQRQTEKLAIIETNIDDQTPQVLGYVMERLFAEGALDCYFTAVQMKKNRPGTLISILCRLDDCDRMIELLFTETTTLGARLCEVERRSLPREIVRVETEYGQIDVKAASVDGRIREGTPEYEQCRQAAISHAVPLRVVETAARHAFKQAQGSAAGNNEQ